MNEFDRHFEASRKRMRFAMIFNMVFFALILGGIIMFGVTLYQMGPSGIGEFFRQIADGFNGKAGS